LNKILRMPAPWFDNPLNTSGALSNKLSIDTKQASNITANNLFLILQGVGAFATALIIAFYYNWRIALVGIATMPLLIISAAGQLTFIMGVS
jgi:ABC-type multidrug transport system fused ATPase/permease subunit